MPPATPLLASASSSTPTQEREAKRREAQEERERRAEEKRKAADDRRREKECAKALAQQERAAGRGPRIGRPPMTDAAGGSHHYHGHNVPDDCELEREALLLRARASAAAQAAARGLDASAVEPVAGPPPEFPPPYLQLQVGFVKGVTCEVAKGMCESCYACRHSGMCVLQLCRAMLAAV